MGLEGFGARIPLGSAFVEDSGKLIIISSAGGGGAFGAVVLERESR